MYPALWPDNVRLSDLEERFVCTVCGHCGADVRPLTNQLGLGLVVRALNKLKRMFFAPGGHRAGRVIGLRCIPLPE